MASSWSLIIVRTESARAVTRSDRGSQSGNFHLTQLRYSSTQDSVGVQPSEAKLAGHRGTKGFGGLT